MADEPKPQQKWFHTAPGYLTATAALVGSITAAITGLSQLGVFHKSDTPPAPVVAPAAPSAASQHGSARRGAPGVSRSSERNEPQRGASRTRARAPRLRARRSRPTTAPAATPPAAAPPAAAPAPAPAPAPPPAPVAKTGNIGPGTTIELASGSRVCSTSSSRRRQVHDDDGDDCERQQRHLTSRRHAGDSERRNAAKAPVYITAKGVSIDVAGKTVPITGTATAHTEFTAAPTQKGIGIGACIPQGGRVSLRLSDGVSRHAVTAL